MDFGMLAPEVTSARMYAGPGSGPMLAAAAGWDALGGQLRSTAASYSSVIAGLTTGWRGPSSAAMATAVAPYVAWMSTTAAQAEQAATQARAAVAAYEAAFAATVPPAVIAANRARLASLVATNVFGQNTSAIAATEAAYAEMWAQDAAAMYGYAASSASATHLTPFTSPPPITTPGGVASHAAVVAQAAGTSAGASARSMLSQPMSQLMSAVPWSLQRLAAPAGADPPSLQTLLSSLLPLVVGLQAYEFTTPASLPARNALVSSTLGFGLDARGFTTGQLPVPLVPGALYPPLVGPGGARPAVSAGLGRAGVAGALSVPPSWAAATPAVRLAATVLQGGGPAAAPLVAAVGQGNLFGQMALASLAGGATGVATGGVVSRAVSGAGAREEGPSSGRGKDGKTPDKLKRVLAELSQKPESVQHWHTDKAHLESLLEQLSTKPGIHAVHVSAVDKPNPARPTARWG
ncbi:PPE family protein [Mycobacterium sp. SM1]|uniref:PPE family protein n=1 Tax=Mycobacterium sp. SM1 TaxID=2816243 RepID=UPI001BCD810E|nr:PPE family protein [Mycobacterium sp. SM1]MBS4729195.1 PPE family protein [Mycobacterium sp. SM1]